MEKNNILYKIINGESLQCLACNNFCRIREGEVGLCGVRQNIKGKLKVLVYGRVIAVNIDPIEKKPFFHFYPGSFAYSLGTMGCNFSCKNCHNFDISQIFCQKGKIKEYQNLNWGYPLEPKKVVEEAKKNDCHIIAYTYNEPTVWVEYALETMKIAKKEGLKNVWASNGYMSDQTLNAIIPYLDAINIDIKSFDESFYNENCGAKLKPVLDNCKKLVKNKIWLEVTTLIIPNLSDKEEMLRKIARFIKNELGDSIPWHVSAFFGLISWKLKNIVSTPVEKIKRVCEIGKEEGLKYVYSGNVLDGDKEDTFCPKCNFKVIGRDGYKIKKYDKSGKCPKCGYQIEGRF